MHPASYELNASSSGGAPFLPPFSGLSTDQDGDPESGGPKPLPAQDPLLVSILSKLGTTNGAGKAPEGSALPKLGSGGDMDINIRLWLVDYQDLRLEAQIGEGAFGRVRQNWLGKPSPQAEAAGTHQRAGCREACCGPWRVGGCHCWEPTLQGPHAAECRSMWAGFARQMSL